MMEDKKKCPYCGGSNSDYIEAVGGEYVGLIMRKNGSVRPYVCLDCGIVYVPKDVCDRIRRRQKNA